MEFLALKLLLSLGIGGLIGLEREAHHNPLKKKNDESLHSVGIRTFALITALGTLAGLLMDTYFPFFLLLSGSIFVLIVTYYILQSMHSKDNGFTTELSMFFSYLIGVFLAGDFLPLQIIFAIAVMLIVVLSRKEDIKNILYKINREEIYAFTSFALVTLVILPFLPNSPLSISDAPQFETFLSSYGIKLGAFAKIELFNPFRFWLIVVLITGIDMAGYLLTRLIGPNRGVVISSLVGGLVSSTAATLALANQSKTQKNINRLTGAAILATCTSILPIFALIASVNAPFLVSITPTLIVIVLSSLAVGSFFIYSGRKDDKKSKKLTQKIKTESEIFSIGPALKFGMLFIIVSIVTKISLLLFGQTGFLVSSAIAGFTGIDAATLNISELAGESIPVKLAIFTFVIVNAVNLGAKVFYSYVQGAKKFAVKLGVGMFIVVLCSLIGLVLN